MKIQFGRLITYRFLIFTKFKRAVSCNPTLTMEFIQKHPDKPWDWFSISKNPNLTMEFVNKNLNKPWNWYYISQNSNINMEDIEKNPDKPWNWYYVSKNPNLTIEFINKNPDKYWDWNVILQNSFQKYILSIMAYRIQKKYHVFKLKSFFKKLVLKSRIKAEIECLPGVGIEYFKGMERFESMCK